MSHFESDFMCASTGNDYQFDSRIVEFSLRRINRYDLGNFIARAVRRNDFHARIARLFLYPVGDGRSER